MTHLRDVDLSQRLTRHEEAEQLGWAQDRLAQLRLALGGQIGGELGPPLLVALEGWDAAGKGGAIKRLLASLDPRHVRTVSFAAPTPDELRHHWLWRFWAPLPGKGGMAVFDRTWYGRVLVERVEGFASVDEWRRAYREIREFEQQLVDHGTLIVKMWVHISDEEQLRRFEARAADPLKQWKLTDEDWRNRDKRADYEEAIEDMLAETDTAAAPWDLIAGDNKRFARVQVLNTVISRIEERAAAIGFVLPDPLPPKS